MRATANRAKHSLVDSAAGAFAGQVVPYAFSWESFLVKELLAMTSISVSEQSVIHRCELSNKSAYDGRNDPHIDHTVVQNCGSPE